MYRLPPPVRLVLTITVFALPVIFFALFYFYPLGAILRLGLAPEGQPELGAFGELFRSRRFLSVLWFTTWQAALSTILTLIVAFPGAYVLSRYRFRGKTAVRALATLPFVLPTVVVATAFVALIGPQGVLNNWLRDLLGLAVGPIRLSQTVWIILLAHVFYNYSVALRLLGAYWQNLSPALSQAAQMLGASPWRAFREVTLPLLAPAVMAAAVLIFIFCFTSFGVIVILGGPRFATLEVEIYRQALNLFNLPLAAALSLWQIVFTFILMWFYTRTQARFSRPLAAGARQAVEKPVVTWRQKWLVYGNVAAIVVLIGAPLAALVTRSFRGQTGPTTTFYRALFANRDDSLFFVPPGTAILNSVAIALAAMVMAVTLGLISAQMLARWERPPGWIANARVGNRAPARPAADVAAGDVGRDARLGLPGSPRPPAAQPAIVDPHSAHRPRRSRAALCLAQRVARLQSHRAVAPRGGCGFGGRRLAGVARGRLAADPAAAAGRGGVRLHHQHGRVWGDGLPGPAGDAHAAGGHLPLSRPAGRAQFRPGAGHERDPHAGLRGGLCRHRTLPRRR
jgi:ABC-type Fe3+ transport system permease subunit